MAVPTFTTVDDLKDEYRAAVIHVAMLAKMLEHIDFAKLIRAIDHADSVGPLLDPTLWRDKHRAMLEDREMLVAAQNLVAKLKRPLTPPRRLRGETDV